MPLQSGAYKPIDDEFEVSPGTDADIYLNGVGYTAGGQPIAQTQIGDTVVQLQNSIANSLKITQDQARLILFIGAGLLLFKVLK